MKNQKINVLITVCMFSAAVFTTAFAQKDSKKVAIKENEEKFDDTKMEEDAEFVVKACDAGLFQVMASELAKRKSSSQMVKDLAEKLIKDHSQFNAELKTVAMEKSITIPSKLSETYQRKFDNLNEETENFDRVYTRVMVNDHSNIIYLYEKEAKKGEVAEIKSWASKKIPTLKQHMEMAENVRDSVREVSSK
ncbi:MAG: DUF4142 domain-containing protein [Bacteroidetes bacterium]|nr:DUF4142 domain-containing protein [Bacteroidota bacterium]